MTYVSGGELDTCPPPAAGLDRGAALSAFVARVSANRGSEWASKNYKDTICQMIDVLHAKRVMEIGGGRWPLLSQDEISGSGISYVVNDISESELALAPPYVEKACFDVAQKSMAGQQHLLNKIDLMFSHNVFEHVGDVHLAYSNIAKLLSPGGVCLNFHPVLFSPPFVVNWLLPETLSARLLRLFFPHRNAQEVPKHPARYDHCAISERERSALLDLGFSEAYQVPFWYHDYFAKIPLLREADTALSTMADRNNWTGLASYCFTIVQK